MRLPILLFFAFAAPVLLVVVLMNGAAGPAGPAGNAADPSAVIAEIDGLKITRKDVDRARKENLDALTQIPENQQTRFLASVVAIQKLSTRAAKNEGLMESPEVKERMNHQKDRILQDAWIEKEMRSRVTEEKIRSYFDDFVASGLANQEEAVEEARVRHILFASKADAEAAVKRLEEGEDFAELAGELSLGPSASRGGDLGYFLAGEMVKPFSEAAFALQPGELSAPVETEFGWHVILLEDRRVVPPPDFEDLKEQIGAFLEQQERSKLFDEMLTSHELEIYAEDKPLAPVFDDDVPLEKQP